MGFFLLLYNVGLVLVLLLAAPVWLLYLWFTPKARAGFRQKLGCYPPSLIQRLGEREPGRQRIWLHAVSVGEFNALKPLIAALEPDFDLVLSTTTRTGHALARKTCPHLALVYFPYDLRFAINRALQHIDPDMLIIAETELWPNVIDRLSRGHRIPVVLINGRLSRSSYNGYQLARALFRPVLRQLTHIYVQSQRDFERLQALGDLAPERITVAGNLKFDLIPSVDPIQHNILAHLLNLSPEDTVLTLASTHSGEDGPLIDAYLRLRKNFPELKLVIAPRHPDRVSEIRRILNAKALPYSVRSQLSEHSPNPHAIVILDSIGELLTVYSMSTVAVMGGSFIERGGQNPIEPISQRVPVIFGPHMENFALISTLILETGAGFQSQGAAGIIQPVTELLTQPEIYTSIVENGQQLLETNRGARETIEAGLRALLI